MDEKRLKQLREETLKFRGALAHLKTTTGRRRYENCSSYIISVTDNPFLADEFALERSKGIRRLSSKTQVAVLPQNLYLRDRLTHTLEVVSVGVEIACILGLNTSLVRAIALGHDIGHVPFGHPGEDYLSAKIGRPFTHEIMGVVVAQHVERHGLGLNLTFEVLDGMMRHSGRNVSKSMTQEAWANRYADKIAYLFADYNDLQRMQFRHLPERLIKLMNQFGSTQRERTAIAIFELCKESAEEGKVTFEKSEFAKMFHELRSLMYQVYPMVTHQKPAYVLDPLWDLLSGIKGVAPELVFALMSDRDVVALTQTTMPGVLQLNQTSVGELMEDIQKLTEKGIDITNPDLEWGYAK